MRWKWTDIWLFFQGLGGLAVAVGAVLAGIRFLRRQLGRPDIIVQYFYAANTAPPSLLEEVRAMSQVDSRESTQDREHCRALASIRELRHINELQALRISIHNVSDRSVPGIRLFVDRVALYPPFDIVVDADFLGPDDTPDFMEGAGWKPGLILPPIPEMPAGGKLRLTIYGVLFLDGAIRVTTQQGSRSRVEALVLVPQSSVLRLLHKPIHPWES